MTAPADIGTVTTLQRIELAHDAHGPEGAPPVLLLHGLSGARSSWGAVVAALDGYRLLVPDLRGHGDSPRAPDPSAYRVEHYTADVVDLLERVVGGPSFVVGHSLGGLIAAQLCHDRPDLARAVFLEDPPLFLGGGAFDRTIFGALFPALQELLRSFGREGLDVDDIFERIRHFPDLRGAGTYEEVQGAEKVRLQASVWHRVDSEALSAAIDGTLFAAHDPSRPLGRPAAVLRAELGAAFLPEHEEPFLAANPGASVECITGSTHGIHDDVTERFTATLLAFLAANGA